MIHPRRFSLADQVRKLRGELRDAERAKKEDKAITVLAKLCELEPNDLRSRQKLASYLSRKGQLVEAQVHLQQCANGYAMEGFLNKAIQVVKELVENSLDAGATNITVLVENGGFDRLVIEDNGSGIANEDLPLSLDRHATSKLSSKEDLASIASLRFRGEALASIGMV